MDGLCWTPLGLEGFWVTALADTPIGLFAGTHDHGVFRFDEALGDWEALGLDHAIVSSIVYTATDTPRLIVGVYPFADETTEAAAFASVDGGSTWLAWDGGRAAADGNRAWAYSLAVDPTNPERLYMGDDWAVLRSDDGGSSWTRLWGEPGGAGTNVVALAISPLGDGRVLAGGETAVFTAFVLHSPDDGASWEWVAPNPREDERTYEENAIHSLAIAPSNSQIALAGMKFGYIIRSVDGGRTWGRVFQSPAERPGFVLDILFTGDRVYAAATDNFAPPASGENIVETDLGLYASSDDGVTWRMLATPPLRGGTDLEERSGREFLIGTRGSGIWLVTRR